ncbi:MAG TPA: branched-chain amino acid ABC transporter substrate-binding protein [Solirubrobacteraceae bacterium]|nr:branched-chain amino acid ABC transporter substrate-binding protein [Solirubrobacteraceae bacterium]
MRLALSRAVAGCLALLSAVALGACGGGGNSSSTAGADATGPAGKTIDIYSSLPMQGPAAAETTEIVNGIKVALAQSGGKAGPFNVEYTALDDSGSAGWDANQTAMNARKAAADPRAVYYIGEFDDDASEVSMPILNEAGIPQVSPTNTYVGLTANAPANYWPTGTRTYLRIVPTDAVQAAGDLLAMHEAGCTRVAVASDQEAYGTGLAKLIDLQKGYYGIDVVNDTGIDPTASSFRTYALSLRGLRADCVLIAGVASKGLVELTKEVHAELPTAKFFGPAGMCTSAWTNAKDGGVPTAVAPLIQCTQVTQSLTAYPGGKAFRAAYQAKFPGSNPGPYAILGYEAMRLGLTTIALLGANGDSKSAVLSELFATTSRHSVLGTYSFNKVGDTTLKAIGLYKVGATGNPTFDKTITPTHVL